VTSGVQQLSETWLQKAIGIIEADFNRSSDTHLIKLEIPFTDKIQLYFKDESFHPTGSLKHRLARSLFLYALTSGWVKEGTTVIEASSGSTAVSEAYFAKMLGLPFIAVMGKGTSPEKVRQIEFYGGQCHLIDEPSLIYEEAQRLADEKGGHYIDQFTYAERATDWRGNNNIAETIFKQMASEKYPEPTWIVVGAGTGGTSATIGRYVHFMRKNTKLCVVDPSHSVFYDYYVGGMDAVKKETPSLIEGIGRPRVEPSFIPQVIDRMIKVPDVASIAAIHFLEQVMGRRCGGSSGTGLYGVFQIMNEMHRAGEEGSIVTLICDDGSRYADTYYDDDWLEANAYDCPPYVRQMMDFYKTGNWKTIKNK
jgi:cysteine synthase A